MKDMMVYKGYAGSAHYSDEDGVFYGKVEFIRDLISYEGTDVESLRDAFKGSVEEYLMLCAKEKREPEKPFKGSFNVRTGSDLHKKTAIYAKEHHLNLNQVVIEALSNYLSAAELHKNRAE